MLPNDAAAVESLVDRALGADVPAVPFPPRPPEAAPRRPRRGLGRAAAGGVIAVLGVGLLVTTQFDSAPRSASAGATPTTRPAPSTTAPPARETRDGVDVEYRRPEDLAAAYRAVAPDDGVAAVGPSTCANGAPEERAWSVPSAPDEMAGRYRCTIEAGRATIWWTVDAEGILAQATARDADLAALFEWWLTQTEP